MSRTYIALIMLLFLVIEGTLFQFVIPDNYNQELIFVPRFLIVILVLIGIHMGRYTSVIYGLIYGMFYDVIYTELLGVYVFGFGLIGYLFALTNKRVQDSILLQLLLIVTAVCLFECYQYGLFQIIGITDMAGELFFKQRLVPTAVLNGAFAILIYYPFKKIVNYVKLQANMRDR
ncbi:rod shape-determining protein MreD [Bacillus solitudinis]|uniref:rod shape-determining protein MreD n=1 Tax=Bacillus solitudinis TaxID=2014074 RepID=UPI000C2380E0|nr:rod shape-determining protein MreD [Bacillus solitudinis]